MIQIEKHGNTYPFWRCVCPNCGCQFTFNQNDTYTENCCGDVYKIVYCPECGYCIDETQWDI